MNIVRSMFVLLLCGWTVAFAAKFSNPFVTLPVDKQAVIQHNFDIIDQAANDVGVDPATMEAISLVETRGGLFGVAGNPVGTPGGRSYGLMQIQIGTVEALLHNHPQLVGKFFGDHNPTRRQITNFLVTNPYGSAYLASYLFKDYSAYLGNNWCLTVLGYNMGVGVAMHAHHCSHNIYVEDVKWFLDNVVIPYRNTSEHPNQNGQSIQETS